MLEDEIEPFLLRIIPSLESEWVGASPSEIDEIERLAGGSLPGFYRWFLTRMGRSLGPLAAAFEDFTAATVLSTYGENLVDLEPPFLLIGRYPDPEQPTDFYYDLRRPSREDALVVSVPTEGGTKRKIAETFREHLAWSALGMFVIDKQPQRCFGTFTAEGGHAAAELSPVMTELGFNSPIRTGPYCCLFERADMAFACSAVVEPENEGLLVFLGGGRDRNAIRRVLGEVGTKSAIEVEVESWEPQGR